MKWRTTNSNTIESDAGYKILQCCCEGVPTGRYVAFIERYKVLGGYNTREEAQTACEHHLYQTQQEIVA